ncbi:MerR family transcriptional regulator [Streptomyces sp. NPDC017254]|uniref:MerR family transcriptional regulator n=1 Tax=unclassified Streptomyces TaxID=2593676 RepID=UPI0037AC97A7
MSDTPHGMTTGAVARRLGVSPTTVRSWDRRYGIGPAIRTDGRHRRWSAADVSMLEEMCRLTAEGVAPAEAAHAALHGRAGAEGPDVLDRAPEHDSVPRARFELPIGERPRKSRRVGAGSGLPLGEVRQECRGLARAAVRLDGPAMEGLLQQFLAEHGLVTAWEDLMAPALNAVGRKWEASDDRYVEVEHLLSWYVSSALRRAGVTGPPTVSTKSPTVLACVPAEQHALPLEALAAGLAERRVPVSMLGAAVPGDALEAAVRRIGPPAVALWAQSRATASQTLATRIAGTAFGVRGARTTPTVLLVGPGWSGIPPARGLIRPAGLREALDAVSLVYG